MNGMTRGFLLAYALLVTCLGGAAAGQDLYFGLLELRATPESLYVRSGETVAVRLDVSQLQQEVKACQAMLGYSSAYLIARPGCVAPGGGAWDELIYSSWDVGAGAAGEIDTAIGVYGQSQPGDGTAADGTVAVITFLAGPSEGATSVVFRPDGDDVHSTFLSSMAAEIVWPTKVNSQPIVIDNMPPGVTITSARQNGQELIGSERKAVQGQVEISVVAADARSGMAGPPAVTVTPQGGSPETAAFTVESSPGTFQYVWTVSPTTLNGVATIRATGYDRAGNASEAAPQTFNVNKNRIAGRIELERFVGSSRTVIFVATGSATKIWCVSVSGFKGYVAPYVLDDVPDGVTGLSAKTAWHLRRKISLSLDPNGQATGDFTDASKLLGGDLNASNLVNVRDYTILRSHWFTTDPEGDINGDGLVNNFDYTIMKLNWYREGDPE